MGRPSRAPSFFIAFPTFSSSSFFFLPIKISFSFTIVSPIHIAVMVTNEKTSVINYLKTRKLSITPCRLALIELFIKKNIAISSSSIEASIKNNFDRVTIYRTLKSFLEIGMIHKVLDNSGEIKYALCNHQCPEHSHDHEHIHFKCSSCEETICIEQIAIPPIKLPEGFKVDSRHLLIQGMCDKCNS